MLLFPLLDDDEKGVHKVDTLGGKQENSIISVMVMFGLLPVIL